MAGESRKTVLTALGANVSVALVKFAAAFLTGSAALFAEGAQSVADILNEAFLLRSLTTSARPADATHPFGYGMERFFWALLAAVGIFVAGAGFSSIEAYRAFVEHSSAGKHYFAIAYAAVVAVGLAEGTSWVRAIRQLRSEAGSDGRRVLDHVRRSSDPSVKTVAAEDTAALLGVVIAGVGIGLHQVTGAGWWEGVAAAVIAVLLVVTAFLLGRDVKDLLIGEAVPSDMREEIEGFLAGRPEVDNVLDVLTMRIGAHSILMAARIDLSASLSSDQVERVSADIDFALNERWPEVQQVFLDATRTGERRPSAGGR